MTPEQIEEMRRKFPAKFSAPILDQITLELRSRLLPPGALILDPYAGVGGIHELRERLEVETIGVEIEPEFAACSPWTVQGDSRQLAQVLDGDTRANVAAVVTSPDYGNRLADQYLGSDNEKCRKCSGTGKVETMPPPDSIRIPCEQCAGSGKARSRRMGYAIALGRKCDPRSGARYHFGKKYRDLHLGILGALTTSLPDGTLLIYNVSSSISDKGYRPVMEWWVTEIARRADFEALVPIETARLKFGANHDARVPAEHLIVARTR